MPINANAIAPQGRGWQVTIWLLVSQLCVMGLGSLPALSSPLPKDQSDPGQMVMLRIEAPMEDVLKAVQQVTQDQIIHGTYSYDKERILYGAHSAASAKVFGAWHGEGKVYYKVADKILAPRFFKDSGDIGTISVRYVVQEAGPNATTLQIDAIFVDARNVKHPSLGSVESSESAAVQQHLKTILAAEKAPPEARTPHELSNPPGTSVSQTSQPAEASNNANSSATNIQELQSRVSALRHEVELRVRDSGAPLKSAPFRSSTTLETLSPQTELLIVVLTPYWYGVETVDGHHGWVHRSELEPLP